MESATVGNQFLDDFFSASVLQRPDRCAVHVAGRCWSYAELNAITCSLEAALSSSTHSGQRNIGVVYGRSVFSYAAVTGIMRSGNVYVPLNSKMPADRLRRILADACIDTVVVDTGDVLPEGVLSALRTAEGLRIVASQGASLPALQTAAESSVVHVLSNNGAREGLSVVAGDHGHGIDQRHPDQLAYIIYTSGSTGEPKGVAITHSSACACIAKLHCMFSTNELDRFSQFSALSFDVSIADLFLCWKSGGALYVPAHSEAMVPLKFAVTHALSVWSSVPSIASFMGKLQLLQPDALPHLRLTLFAGEALPAELARAWTDAAPQSRVFNVYGPTECTIFSAIYEYDRERSRRHGVVPIGVPLPGLRCAIVDEGRRVERDDEPGELWLSGDQLAAGYWRNPTSTEQAFVSWPGEGRAEEIWYRTGDLVSHREAEGLIFRGRMDRQIKLRGIRIELQEVESVLRDVIGCAMVAVIPLRGSGGMCEKIIAYCDRLGADEASIKAGCLERLPAYMVPERIFELGSFPLSANGKIDYPQIAALTAVNAV